jgi:DNA-directed RNA polymerase specialized sigma24 family protein
MQCKYEDLFSDSEFEIIKRKVSVYIRRGSFAQRDRDDVIQECCVHWFNVRGQYQEGKASPKTFLERVLDHKLRDLAECEQTDKRKMNRTPRRNAVSMPILSQSQISESEGKHGRSPGTKGDSYSQEVGAARFRAAFPTKAERNALSDLRATEHLSDVEATWHRCLECVG